MGAWKKLNQQDAFVTSYTAKKTWIASPAELEDYGIQALLAESSSTQEYYLDPNSLYSGSNVGSGEYKELVFRSIDQLYYRDFDSATGELTYSSSYDHYIESSLTSGSRKLGSEAAVYSIPRSKTGTHIEPGSVQLSVEELFLEEGYLDPYYFADTYPVYDDGEGKLIQAGNVVGDIIYSHGILIITDETLLQVYKQDIRQYLRWKSNQPIYTYNYNVKLSDYEFNYTQNPTALTGSDNTVKNHLTGSEFQPYITTVGLYNDANELVAVAKLAQPLPKSKNTETTIQVKLDI